VANFKKLHHFSSYSVTVIDPRIGFEPGTPEDESDPASYGVCFFLL